MVVGGVGIHVKGGVDVIDFCVILSRALGFVHVIVVQEHLDHPHLAWGDVVCKNLTRHTSTFRIIPGPLYYW